jgi:hypothetical protein
LLSVFGVSAIIGLISGSIALLDVSTNGFMQIVALVALIITTILFLALLPFYVRLKGIRQF